MDIPLMDVIYRLQYSSRTALRLTLLPADSSKPVLIDVKRSVQYDTASEGEDYDNYTLNGNRSLDAIIYNRSNEIHHVYLRQRHPDNGLWSFCNVGMFSSVNGGRVTIWVTWYQTNFDFDNME